MTSPDVMKRFSSATAQARTYDCTAKSKKKLEKLTKTARTRIFDPT